jgi:hypothetical protein
MGHVAQVHLVIAVHLHQHVAATGDGLAIASQGGAADALVLGQLDDHHARIGGVLLDEFAGMLRAGVVDADDAFDPRRRLRQHVEDVGLDLETRDHQPHARAFQRRVESEQGAAAILAQRDPLAYGLVDRRHAPG